MGNKVKYLGNKVKYLGNKVNIWAIKCYFIAQILAENWAVKTQVGSQSLLLHVLLSPCNACRHW
jgi:hypothetical protein